MHFEGLPKVAARKNTVNGRDSTAAVIHFYLTSAEAPSSVTAPNCSDSGLWPAGD